MSEFKSGLYRTAAGRLLAVIVGSQPDGHRYISMDGEPGVGYTTTATLSKAEHLGPAVISDDDGDRYYWMRKTAEVRAELVRACDDRNAYRRNWDEAKDEIAKLTEELDAAEAERKISNQYGEATSRLLQQTAIERDVLQEEVARLKRGDWTAEELTDLDKSLSGCGPWKSLLADKSVEYSVGEDGVERYGFETVTVFRREGREASVRCFAPIAFRAIDSRSVKEFPGREEAEAWCVEQLKPKWRAAREDGSDLQKRCRVRDEEDEDWTEYSHLVGIIEHKYRYVVGDLYDCAPTTYQFCEVQE